MTSRRDFLRGAAGALGASLAAPLASGCGDGSPYPPLPVDLPSFDESAASSSTVAVTFAHGVASGDPDDASVRLWTRVTPDDAGATEVPVFVEVARDPEFVERVFATTQTAASASDFTLQVEAAGLVWGRTYYYRFRAAAASSPVGRTRLAPGDAEGDPQRLVFGAVSCSNLSRGYFHAYGHLAARDDLDAVLHLGDFIYEGGGESQPRAHEPPYEAVTLDDYRTRHAQYRREPELIELLRQHPIIPVWDDHESANNAYRDGANAHDPSTEGDWATRKEAAKQAYFEWLPVRAERDHLHRRLRYGGLVDVLMLDTRLEGRDAPIADLADETSARSLLGAEQEAWLTTQLQDSAARWVLIGQQVMVGQLDLPVDNFDQWDGYPSARGRLFDAIEAHARGRAAVLTGDLHSSWALGLARDPFAEGYDPARDNLAVELVAPGVTSPFPLPMNLAMQVGRGIPDSHPHVTFADLAYRGYFVLEVTRGELHADWFIVDGIDADQGELSFLRGVTTARGAATLVERDSPRRVRAAPPLAP